MFDSIRTRLTLLHVVTLALVLICFSVVVYVLLSRHLYSRLDSDLRNTIMETGLSLTNDLNRGQTETEAASFALDEHIGPRQAAAIFASGGRLIGENPALGNIHATLPSADSISTEQARLYTIPVSSSAGRRVAVQRIVQGNAGQSYLIVVSQPLDRVSNELKTIRLILSLAVLVALLLAGGGGWFVARRSLAPVMDMMEQARRISAENLEERLPIANPHDELGRLASTFNELLARLNESFRQQRRFMADASHELRTPLSVMQTATGVTLKKENRHESEYRDALRIIDEQVRRLTRIVEEMFTLARSDAGDRSLQYSDFSLDQMILETTRAGKVLGVSKGVQVEVGKLSEAPCSGDEDLLRQMLLNLLENAIKNTPPGGNVGIRLERQPLQYDIFISDTGVGIPLEARPHIFDRFYRADRARARDQNPDGGGGAGLGLSIAKWIVEAHRGQLELQRSDQTGSVFVVSLPFANIQ